VESTDAMQMGYSFCTDKHSFAQREKLNLLNSLYI